MELRNLQASDIFTMVKILNGIGLTKIKSAIDFEKIKELRKNMTDKNADDIASQVGTDVILSVVSVIFENLPAIESDLYKFVGSLAGIKSTEVAKLDLNVFVDLIFDIFKKEEFVDFFKRASKLIKSE